jgi:hypothetical protein
VNTLAGIYSLKPGDGDEKRERESERESEDGVKDAVRETNHIIMFRWGWGGVG